ncbi:MAG TPA: sugar phosphate nucleotidyltransferase, partial [Gemmatimonadales bacterium]|nr:sugar phosphate nucleotidyltransferase [Gemmatimonadales bacterium]
MTILRKPQARIEPADGIEDRLWAVVLAGGEGARLRPLTRRVCGDDRPKQYAALVGSRSLLRQTLDRVALRIAVERTVVVTLRAHARYIAAELAGARGLHVLVQPEDRGTAAGVLLPAHWIQRHDPGATIAVFPSDHFIREELAFMDHVAQVAGAVRRGGEGIVLLGATPTAAETE